MYGMFGSLPSDLNAPQPHAVKSLRSIGVAYAAYDCWHDTSCSTLHDPTFLIAASGVHRFYDRDDTVVGVRSRTRTQQK